MKYVLEWILSMALKWDSSGRTWLWLMEELHCVLAHWRCWRTSTLCLTAQNTPPLCWDCALKGSLAPFGFPFRRRAGRELSRPWGSMRCSCRLRAPGLSSLDEECVAHMHIMTVFLRQSLTERREERLNIFCNPFPFWGTEKTLQKEQGRPQKEKPWAQFYPWLCHHHFYQRH